MGRSKIHLHLDLDLQKYWASGKTVRGPVNKNVRGRPEENSDTVPDIVEDIFEAQR
jgi:hypothetical protein